MTTSIERFRTEEKVRIAYLRFAGNIEKVSQHTGIDFAYVKQICDKYNRELKKNPNKFVGASIAGYVVFGSEERKQHLREALEEEQNKQPEILSCCCKAHTQIIDDSDEVYRICLKCGGKCDTYIQENKNINTIIDLVEQLRIEDQTTVESVIKLGVVKEAPLPQPTVKVQQNNIILNNEQIKNIEQLNPMKQAKLAQELKQQIVDAQFEPKVEDVKPNQTSN